MADELSKRITYVPAATERRPVPAYPIIGNEYPLASPESHLAALESVRETADPVSRAIGLSVRLLPFTIAWGILAGVLVFVLDGDIVVPFLLFALATAVTYWLMDRTEYEYSAGGLERFKASLAAELREQELRQSHELKERALDAYIKSMSER